jgi:membrane protease YdiL (CAAX protease family)
VTSNVDAAAAPARTRPWLAGEIAPPARASRTGAVCSLVVVALYALSYALASEVAAAAVLAGIAVATVVATAARAPYAVHVGVLALLSGLAPRLPVIGAVWPLNVVTPLVAYAVLAGAASPLRQTSRWLRLGRVDRTTWLAIAAFATASAIALVVWRFASHTDLTRFRAFVPGFVLALPKGVLVVGLPIGIGLYAMLNAAVEEVIWRGVAMQALESAVGRGTLACALQAIAFGVWHYRGFPSGIVGSALAGIFALMMGILRMRGRGMLAPWIAHVLADTTIFVLVAVMVLAG